MNFTGYVLADSVGPDMWNNLLHPEDLARAREMRDMGLLAGHRRRLPHRVPIQCEGRELPLVSGAGFAASE